MSLVRLDNSAIRASAVFREPLLWWTAEAPLRFFRAMYGALSNILHIQTSDLAATAGATLADCSASLRIFGSSNTLTLRANALVADFPAIPAAQLGFVNTLILQSYDAIKNEFTELEAASINSNAAHYFKLIDEKQPQNLLDRTDQVWLQGLSGAHADLVVEPALRFKLVDKEGRWNGRVTVEKSEISASDIFLHREIQINNLIGLDSTTALFELVTTIDYRILDIAGLKLEETGC
jgi:hypothetical protein